jgi:hypothetical protein
MTDFERWWYDEGSANRPVDEDIEEFAKRMCQVAWSNGAFVEREACAVIAETPVSGEQDDITMEAKDRVATAIRARSQHD